MKSRILVTAAHCVVYLEERRAAGVQVQVLVGASDMWAGRPGGAALGGRSSRLLVGSAIRHPEFNPVTLEHDVAVISLMGPFEEKREYVRLARSLPPFGTKFQIFGWGMVGPTGGNSRILRGATISLSDPGLCGSIGIPEDSICSANAQGVDACAGDSGGPAVEIVGINQTARQVGIVSYGLECMGRGSVQGVYSSVPANYEWMSGMVNALSGGNSTGFGYGGGPPAWVPAVVPAVTGSYALAVLAIVLLHKRK